MNIFFIAFDPQEAAKRHGDKHVIKMILESAQMLCTCQWFASDPTWADRYRDAIGKPPCKACYAKHPCNIWLRKSLENYAWLCSLALALCEEKRARWAHSPAHVLEPALKWLSLNPPPLPSTGTITPPATAMPVECKEDAPESLSRSLRCYRRYYVTKEASGIVAYKRMPERRPYWLG